MTGQLRLLLRLRLQTMFRGKGKVAFVGRILSVVILVPLALGLGYWTLGTTRWLAEAHAHLVPAWTHLVALFAYFMIVVMPVIGFGGSEFYDITKLFHLPVSHRTVFVAQAMGLMFGTTVLFLLPALLGLAVGLPGGSGLTLIRLVLVLVFLFHAVALGLLLQLAMLNTLRSRRFRDLAMIAGMLIWGAVFVCFRLMMERGASRGDILPALDVARDAWYLVIVPSSWASSVIAPGVGMPQLLLFGLGFLPLTVFMVLLSAVLQERAFFGEIPLARPRTPVQPLVAPRRTPFPLSRLPGEVRAVARTELRLLRREPAVKMLLIQQFVFFMVPMLIAFWRIGETSAEQLEMILQAGIFVCLFVESNLALNLLGLEGPGIAHLLTTPVSRRKVLAGKVLACFGLWQVVNLALVTAIWVALAILGRPLGAARIGNLYIGITSALVVLLGLGSVVSVLAPIRIAARGRRALAHSQTSREGCALAMVRMLSFLVLVVLLVPVALLCYPWGLGPLSLLSLPYAAGLLAVGLMWGSRILQSREEQLVLSLARAQD